MTAEAYDEILATAEDVLARAQAGEDFDSLIETYGQDTGMNNEPNKSRGYLSATVCPSMSRASRMPRWRLKRLATCLPNW